MSQKREVRGGGAGTQGHPAAPGSPRRPPPAPRPAQQHVTSRGGPRRRALAESRAWPRPSGGGGQSARRAASMCEPCARGGRGRGLPARARRSSAGAQRGSAPRRALSATTPRSAVQSKAKQRGAKSKAKQRDATHSSAPGHGGPFVRSTPPPPHSLRSPSSPLRAGAWRSVRAPSSSGRPAARPALPCPALPRGYLASAAACLRDCAHAPAGAAGTRRRLLPPRGPPPRGCGTPAPAVGQRGHTAGRPGTRQGDRGRGGASPAALPPQPRAVHSCPPPSSPSRSLTFILLLDPLQVAGGLQQHLHVAQEGVHARVAQLPQGAAGPAGRPRSPPRLPPRPAALPHAPAAPKPRALHGGGGGGGAACAAVGPCAAGPGAAAVLALPLWRCFGPRGRRRRPAPSPLPDGAARPGPACGELRRRAGKVCCRHGSPRVASCRFMSPHVAPCRPVSPHAVPCHLMLPHVAPCPLMLPRVASRHLMLPVSPHVTPCHPM